MGTGSEIVFKRLVFADGICIVLLFWFIFAIPGRLFNAPTSYVLEAANGNLLSAAIASDGQWRFPAGHEVPPKFEACILAFEDARFYKHPGFDPLAMARAVRQNIRAKRVVSGGSTLSMQVIRLSRQKQRTWYQKLIEVVLAFRLEATYDKTEILSLYAANAPFGSNVVGLEAASWRYYGRAPETLSWGEMATLAVLPNSPSLVRPGKGTQKLIIKRNTLLDKLVKKGIIDAETSNLSKLETVPGKPLPLPQHAPHLLQRFRLDNNGKNSPTRLSSTIDEGLQLRVNSLLNRYQARYRTNDINNIAALVVETRTGKVMSYTGNVYHPDQPQLESHVDMIHARRSPGSTLKPLLYASMLTDGLLLPKTLIPDVPTQIAGYIPENYDLGYDGAIHADAALSRSLNIPAVKMLQQYKYERFYDKLKKTGLTTLDKPAGHYGLSLILGGAEITMWELTNAYLGMARSLMHYNTYKGFYDPADYRPSTYFKEEVRSRSEYDRNSLYDHGAIWATFNAMEEVMRPGDEGLWQQFASSGKVAWKTGTSFGFRDGWAIGLTPGYVVCVWVGNADGEGRPGLTGIDTAAPVLFEIFRMLPQTKWFDVPDTKLIKLKVCKESGYKASEYCVDTYIEKTPSAGAKTGLCPYHKLIHLDRMAAYRVTDACEQPAMMQARAWFILPPAMEYYYRVKHSDYKALPPYKPGCEETGGNAMEIIYPKNNTLVYIPLEGSGERGRVILTAAHRDPNATILWHIDDSYMSSTKHFHEVALETTPGKHKLTLVDDKGERVVQYFVVKGK